MQDNRFPIVFIAGAVGLAGVVGSLYVYRSGKDRSPVPAAAETAGKKPAVVEPKTSPIPATQQESLVDESQDPETALANAGVGLAVVDPAELLAEIGASRSRSLRTCAITAGAPVNVQSTWPDITSVTEGAVPR